MTALNAEAYGDNDYGDINDMPEEYSGSISNITSPTCFPFAPLQTHPYLFQQ